MFEPPAEWVGTFDFVLEIFTVQALPIDIRPKAAASVAQFVAPGGELLVVTIGTEEDEGRTGPPWPFIRDELALFKTDGLTEAQFDTLPSSFERASHMWRVLYQRA